MSIHRMITTVEGPVQCRCASFVILVDSCENVMEDLTVDILQEDTVIYDVIMNHTSTFEKFPFFSNIHKIMTFIFIIHPDREQKQ